MVAVMVRKQELNLHFVKDYVNFLNGDSSKVDNLLKYAFYLLVKKSDELSLNFAYSIIINYTLKFDDYKPLIEFSIIFGYSPILNIIYNDFHFESSRKMKNFIAKFYIEDNRYKNKVLTSGQKIIYKMVNVKSDYSVVAPTSFGKTDLMLESALNSKGDSIIIVPLIALLNQVKTDLWNMAKDVNIKVKVITHHEIKRSSNYKNIYVLTQERCFELLKNNELTNVTDLFIDEAHKLLSKDDRTYKLAQIILLLKKRFACSIRYYSPVLINPNSIKIKSLHENDFETVNGIRDMKCYNYFFYHKNKKIIYIPNTNKITDDYVIDEDYKDFDDYIIKNSKSKNILFYNSPKNVELSAIDFSNKIEKTIQIDCKDLIDFIGDDYYILDVIKKGVIYIHGQMPDLVKVYLLNMYRDIDKINYLFTNSSILEGVNTPSDNLFICDYNIGHNNIMKPKDFINLRGRINRISDIVKERDLSRLICNTHFYANTDYKKNKIRKKIINPCYGIVLEDDIENEYLEAYYKLDKSEKFKKSLEQINLIDNTIDT